MDKDFISDLSVNNAVNKSIRLNFRLAGIMLVIGGVSMILNIILEIRRYNLWQDSPEPQNWYLFTEKNITPVVYLVVWSLYMIGLRFFYFGWKYQKMALDTGDEHLLEKGFNYLLIASKLAIGEMCVSFFLTAFYFLEPFLY